MEWKDDNKAQTVAKMHRWSGRFMLLLSNATIASGVWHYYDNRLKGDVRRVLGAYSFVLFVVLFILFYLVRYISDKYSNGRVEIPELQGKQKGSKFGSYTTE